eukprot:TRINITY_DN32013_c0_g1_i1.p2 TRINITY_DN32013_c0_g1~~TRINITY_DN32013_c0_g1_i1.p2  ORF type:complete len:324 (+),score=87.83 TRINITY_DN32013_c0_g1_i1:63-1034(+)
MAWPGGVYPEDVRLRSAFVSGLQETLHDSDVREYFQEIVGPVQHVRMMHERGGGAFRGLAVITFHKRDSVQKAISRCNGDVFEGCKLTVRQDQGPAALRDPAAGYQPDASNIPTPSQSDYKVTFGGRAQGEERRRSRSRSYSGSRSRSYSSSYSSRGRRRSRSRTPPRGPSEAELAARRGDQEGFLRAKKKERTTQMLGSTIGRGAVMYKVMREGTGQHHPAYGAPCVVHYEGMFLDGTPFDSSYSRGEPSTMAPKDVIKGWTIALQRMVEGDKWELYIPPDMGYGAAGKPPRIPPNKALVFQMELLQIKGVKVPRHGGGGRR